jgi:hypothetical protein
MTRTRVGYSSNELGATLLYTAGTHASLGSVDHRSSRDKAANNIRVKGKPVPISPKAMCRSREDHNTDHNF